MKPSLDVLFLAFGALGHAAASLHDTSVTWLKTEESVIVKLDTPGYPLWLMDKANAPVHHKDAGDFYWPQDKPSALLFNLSLSHDHKKLYLNHEAILPLDNPDRPPRIQAYQVPADITPAQIRFLAGSEGLMNRQYEGLTLGYRFLELDYDRVVWSDPQSRVYMNNVPMLRFRVMGIGAHSRSDVLDASQQGVLHVTLTDLNHRESDAPERNFAITGIDITAVGSESHRYISSTEPEQEECTLKSWRCPDNGLFESSAGESPYYRFIWRERFDQYGRIGSLRHELLQKLNGILPAIENFFENNGETIFFSILGVVVLLSSVATGAAAIVLLAKLWMWCRSKRERKIRGLADDDRLLGEEDAVVIYVDNVMGEDEKETPPALPPRPVEVLIDVEAGETA